MNRTPEQVMKACQIGTSNHHAANDLHAECYGTIGKLLNERAQLVAALQSAAGVCQAFATQSQTASIAASDADALLFKIKDGQA